MEAVYRKAEKGREGRREESMKRVRERGREEGREAKIKSFHTSLYCMNDANYNNYI